MKSLLLVTSLLGLGLAVATTGACSAESSSPPPDSDTGKGGSSAGTTGIGILPSGGMASPAAGGKASGAATGGTASSTAGTGTGGSGALGACPSPPAAGTMTDLAIDDLEDKDNGVMKVGGRSGYWYTYLDTFGSMITPAPDPAGAKPLMPGVTDCHGGTACVIVTGTTSAEDEVAMKYPFAGVGFDFSNAGKPCAYNASAYTGIKLWARGDAEVTIKVNIPATADSTGGGTCATGCSNGHGKKVVLTPTWAEIDLPFASIAQDPAWGTMAPFDKAALLSLQVQFPSGGAFNGALDDITFY